MVLTSISTWYQESAQWKLFHHDAIAQMKDEKPKEKILEEVIGDVKKMNGTGGKIFNEASAQMSSTIVREEDKRKEEKEINSDTGTMIDQSIVTNKHVN